METTLTQHLLDETKELWASGKKIMVQVAANLLDLRDEGSWKESGKTFPQFVEDEIDIRQSQTSKLLTIGGYFLKIKTIEEIGPVDYEKLYQATMLPGTVEENLAKARTLTRRELKEEMNDSEPHEHEAISICKHCSIRL